MSPGKTRQAWAIPRIAHADHPVAVKASKWQLAPRNRTHQEPEANAEDEEQQPIALEQRQPVDQPTA
ncbi:MAG: hypothetical protein ACMUJJ_15840 [Roseicyclus sp.]|uniref:hypothetical protein n=1 Tax=Roseicyclus sp. TaxID=1914329 RepID=UPI003A84FD65